MGDWVIVPAGTRGQKCRGSTCRALIYFVRHPVTDAWLPVECDVVGGRRPSDTRDVRQLDLLTNKTTVYDGRGVVHSPRCVNAEEIRQRFTGPGTR